MPVSSENYEKEISTDGKNVRSIKCTYCQSIILMPLSGEYVKTENQLPLMKQNKNTESDPETETISFFWLVPDMFTFQNIGFSNTVGNTKYLTCADCEAGPIGYHDLPTQKSYIAFSRIKHC